MTQARAAAIGIAATALLAVAATIALNVGNVAISPAEVWHAVTGTGDSVSAHAVVWYIRLPRIVVAALVGAGLAAVGTAMQAILRNPLAEPGITGVSAGAALGAVAGITLGFAGASQWGIPLAAFIGAAAASAVLYAVMVLRRDLGATGLILVGVSISSLAGAGISALIANAESDSLARGAVFWLAGDLELRDWGHAALAAGPILLGIAYIASRARVLDTLALGEEVAATSGIAVRRERVALLMVAAVVTGAAVAVSGIISFVGLVVPHAVRLIVGASHQRLGPIATVTGALFLVVADTAARGAFGPAVLPTGVVSALVGAPVFLALLLGRGRT